MDTKQFHDALKSRRQVAGLSQEELARRIGITAVWLGLLERGQRPWDVRVLKRYCEEVGFTQPDYQALPVMYTGQRPRGPRPKGRVLIKLTEAQQLNVEVMAKDLSMTPEAFLVALTDAAWVEYKKGA